MSPRSLEPGSADSAPRLLYSCCPSPFTPEKAPQEAIPWWAWWCPLELGVTAPYLLITSLALLGVIGVFPLLLTANCLHVILIVAGVCLFSSLETILCSLWWRAAARRWGLEAVYIFPVPFWRRLRHRALELHVDDERVWNQGPTPSDRAALFMVALHRDYARLIAWADVWGQDFTVSTFHRTPSWLASLCEVREGAVPRWQPWRYSPRVRARQQLRMFGGILTVRNVRHNAAWKTYWYTYEEPR